MSTYAGDGGDGGNVYTGRTAGASSDGRVIGGAGGRGGDVHFQVGNIHTIKDTLKDHIVSGATYDTYKSQSTLGCLMNTRENVMERISTWADGVDQPAICWLYGPAGAGKSTIAYTIAERYEKQNVCEHYPKGKLAASFFFSRAKSNLNNTSRFFPTIVHQLTVSLPSFQKGVEKVLGDDKSVLTSGLENQFTKLLLDHICLHPHSKPQSMVVVIDGLDECEKGDSKSLIRLLAETYWGTQPPLRFLITSRDEDHIRELLKPKSYSLDLWEFRDDVEIRALFEHDFSELRRGEKGRLMRALPHPWPSKSDLNVLVRKADGLFIYASTLIKFVSDGRGLPQKKLTEAMRHHTGLDPLCEQVLSNAPYSGTKLFREIIGTLICLRHPLSIRNLASLLQFEDHEEIWEYLTGCSSILMIPDDPDGHIQFFHNSFQDFFTHQKLASAKADGPQGSFFIDPVAHNEYISSRCLNFITSRKGHTPTFTYPSLSWLHHLHRSLASKRDNNILDLEAPDKLADRVRDLMNNSCDAWMGTLGKEGNVLETLEDLDGVVCILKAKSSVFADGLTQTLCDLKDHLLVRSMVKCLGNLVGESRLSLSNLQSKVSSDLDLSSVAVRFLILLCNEDSRNDLFENQGIEAENLVNLLRQLLSFHRLGEREHEMVFLTLTELVKKYPEPQFLEGIHLETLAVAGGAFGDVYLGHMGEKAVAIKMMRVFDDDQRRFYKLYMREATIWNLLLHPNVLPFYGIYFDDTRPCLVSPWMDNGNIINYLKKNRNANRVSLLYDVALGLEYLHSVHVVHGDLKGSNILVTNSLRACIADFDLSSVANVFSVSTIARGTLRFQAPELFDGPNLPTQASDVYAFGCVCYEVFVMKSPFYEQNDFAALSKIIKGERPARPSSELVVSRGLDTPMWDMIIKCWSHERWDRPLAKGLVQHLSSRVTLDEPDRATTKEV